MVDLEAEREREPEAVLDNDRVSDLEAVRDRDRDVEAEGVREMEREADKDRDPVTDAVEDLVRVRLGDQERLQGSQRAWKGGGRRRGVHYQRHTGR